MDAAFDQFDHMSESMDREFQRANRFFRDFRETPQETCENSKKSDDCKSAGCSWCDAGAVKPMCNSISNAARLPPAVFSCDPLPGMQINAEFEEDEEDDEEEDMSLWGQFVNNMRGGRRGRDHKGQRPQHGGRQGRQGPPHHGGRHQRGERPPMMEEDEEDEEFFGRPRPMGPRVRSERPEGPEHEGRHHGKGGRGHHGKGGKGHHGRNIRMMRL